MVLLLFASSNRDNLKHNSLIALTLLLGQNGETEYLAVRITWNTLFSELLARIACLRRNRPKTDLVSAGLPPLGQCTKLKLIINMK